MTSAGTPVGECIAARPALEEGGHEIIYQPPEGITIAVPKPTEIKVSGIDSQAVGQAASEIRSYRPPEPYKGKGVRYVGEYIRRKEGKKK